ncbi:MAG TPA: M48 family metallopeptidase [Anaeromyxobacteraceae bacterium]|nr:M48 family metallopeptidase [Anaeromyxobacteraceae bacterium]
MRKWLLGPVSVAALATFFLVGRELAASTGTPIGSASLSPEVIRYFSPAEFARGQAYADGLYWLAAVGIALRLGLLLLLVFTPASAALRSLALRWSRGHSVLATALYLSLLVIGYELLILPLRYYAGFVREHAFQLSTQTQADWFSDWGKGCLLLLGLTVPLGSVLVTLWRRTPKRWALWAWAGCGGLTVALVALAPLIIDPLFNTIRPLEDPVLRQRVLALAERAGLSVDQVYVSDASRRTTPENAYFTGLGATKRVVLYDTLLRHNDPAAVATVVGHELGHWRHGDIWKGIGWSLLGLAICFWCAAHVLAWAGRGRRFHLTGPADMAAVPLVLLVVFVLNLVSLPLQNAISRRMERAADRTALELTRDPAAFIRSEVQLARAGLADLAPPRAVVFLLYTHPPTLDRIRMAEAFAAKLGAPQ